MATKKRKKNVLNFSMQPQIEDAWCWTAVGTSCALFYDLNSGWTQCKVVNKTLNISNCCSSPSSATCNVEGALLNNNHEGSFVTTNIPSSFKNDATAVENLIAELDAGRLVAYRLEITATVNGQGQTGSTFHFVVIAGYELQTDSVDDQGVIVYVFDSFSLEKGYSTMSYDVFKNNYKCHGGTFTIRGVSLTEVGCKVAQTFFTAPIQNT